MSSPRVCPACGHSGPADAMFCVRCGQRLPEGQAPQVSGSSAPSSVPQQQPAASSERINSNLTEAVAVTVIGSACCLFLPTIPGVVAIMHAIRVGDQVTTGDLSAARRSSESAKKWTTIAFALMPVGGLVTLGIAFFGV